MRRLIILLALIASSALFLGAAPGTASAANCSNIWQSTTYWNGWLNFEAHISGCSDVSQVQFGFPNSPVGAAGWHDYYLGYNIYADGVAGAGQIQNIYTPSTDAYVIYEHNAWCGGQTHTVLTAFGYRIKRKATGTWGNWYGNSTTAYNIVC